MARARTVIGTLWGGSPEILKNGEDAWLVDSRNQKEVIQALDEMWSKPDEVRRRGQNAYAKVWEYFQWSSKVSIYLEKLEALCQQP